MNKKKIHLQKPNRFGQLPIPLEVERVMAIRASLGGEIHIQDVDIILYPLISREVINKDISPIRLTSKQSKNTFEIMVEKERHSQQTLFENFHLIDE